VGRGVVLGAVGASQQLLLAWTLGAVTRVQDAFDAA
jgi:hypothetical protein